jgi:ribosomal protein S17E
MVEFITIVSLIAGVLQIILFFKVWGMTNDIKALKKDHFNEVQLQTKAQTASYLRRNLVLGNMDNVKRILLQNFIENVEHRYGEMKRGDYEKDEDGREKWVDYQEKNLKESIAPYVKSLTIQYDKIGEKVPVYISRMETFGDYYQLFVKEDLIIET